MLLFSLARLAALGLVLLCKLSLTMPTDLTVRTTSPEEYDFDDISSPVTSAAVTSLGKYRDLFFNLQLAGALIPGTQQPIGLKTDTQPNVVVFTFRGSVINGAPEIKIPGNGVGAKSFVLKGLSLGCEAATVETVAQPGTACTIVANFSLNGKPVGSDQAIFIPTGGLSNLQKFEFDSYGPIDSVKFTTVVSNLTPVLTAVVMDDMKFTINK